MVMPQREDTIEAIKRLDLLLGVNRVKFHSGMPQYAVIGCSAADLPR